MVWYLLPVTYICVECKWKKTIPRTGDMLTEGYNIFTVCPVCGRENVEKRKATPAEVLFSTIAYRFLESRNINH